MTLQFRRRSRERQAALEGDFPDTGESLTEVLERVRPASYDARTRQWEGASDVGLPDGVVAVKRYGQDTEPLARLRARGQQPDTFPALPQPATARRADCAIFTINRDHSIGLLCGIDRWRIHFDPEAAHARRGFDALRRSALVAGWRPDAYGRWCCPRCKMDPRYATPQPLAHSHPGVRQAKYAGKDAAGNPVFAYTGLPDEFALGVEKELVVLERTAEGANHGTRHRTGAS